MLDGFGLTMTDKNYWDDVPVDIQFPDAPTERNHPLCIFDSEEEDVLFDAYQMLRWAGVPKKKLWPMVMTVELHTIYDRNSLEGYYQEVLEAETAY